MVSNAVYEQQIGSHLIRRGRKLFKAPKAKVSFTGDDGADSLLNDIADHPHAFVLGCIMDRQVKAESVAIPFRFKQCLGDFSIETLAGLSESDVRKIMTKPQPLHRHIEKMSSYFFRAVARIMDEYGGNAANIWNKRRPSSATVVYRFLRFDGVGPKIASMGANILARQFKVPFLDYYSVDISADVHVKRVFGRLGLTDTDATVEQLVFRARGLNPEFPGLLDFATWEIGRNWCRPNSPDCPKCPMAKACISSF